MIKCKISIGKHQYKKWQPNEDQVFIRIFQNWVSKNLREEKPQQKISTESIFIKKKTIKNFGYWDLHALEYNKEIGLCRLPGQSNKNNGKQNKITTEYGNDN